jgi:DNA-directed RNA polymerase subunit E'/Rpb7
MSNSVNKNYSLKLTKDKTPTGKNLTGKNLTGKNLTGKNLTGKNLTTNLHIYIPSLLTQKIVLNYNEVDSDLFNTLEVRLKQFNEGKCIKDGYVKNNSVKLLTYSGGELFSNKLVFECVFECLITNPVESMILNCEAKSITKVGVRAELVTDDNITPYIIFIARDHHYNNEMFSQIKENDMLQVRVLGQRYELNDKFISVIAELVNINNYGTLKKELEGDYGLEVEDTLDSNMEQTGGETKIKLKTKRSGIRVKKNIA